ncbi:unnamed protein product [Mycena citricolor]|uniref:Uncharacterized protein n=1 Tax=Mycena citricolor TaxID=2018698 RepID=A0AAD2K5L1_9AGAR|nr:unnamed protein product [Mycena citricolor]
MYTVGEPENIHPLFKHTISMEGPNGERVRGVALFDGAAGSGVLDSTWFAARKHRLGNVSKPQKRLKMANGTLIPSSAHWEGTVDVGGVRVRAEFEVIDSGGAWTILLGKPILRALRAVQDFRDDTVMVSDGASRMLLYNESSERRSALGTPKGGHWGLRREASVGDELSATSPPRRVDPVLNPQLVDADMTGSCDTNLDNRQEEDDPTEGTTRCRGPRTTPHGNPEGVELCATTPRGEFSPLAQNVRAQLTTLTRTETEAPVSEPHKLQERRQGVNG